MSTVNPEFDPVGSHRVVVGSTQLPVRSSAVSWRSILAGAVAAVALTVLLLILGTGLGLSAVSPWTMEGVSASTFGFAAIAWLIFTQLAASGMGGYLAGRLRTNWTAGHTDEVYFRDYAHGFLAWAVASLLTAVVLTSVVGSIVGGGVRAGAAVAGGAAMALGTVAVSVGGSDEVSSNIDYLVDSLFRDNNISASEVSEIPVGEVTRIYMRALQTGTMPQEDERYIAQLIVQHTDLNQQEAERRVSEGFIRVQTTLEEMEAKVREAADEARKASVYGALWLFVTLLIGAFAACLMAVFGGRLRDS